MMRLKNTIGMLRAYAIQPLFRGMLLLVLSVSAPFDPSAQDQKPFRGTVVDRENGLPIEGAAILLEDSVVAITNTSGYFEFFILGADQLQLAITHVSYSAILLNITPTNFLEVKMDRVIVSLDEIEVTVSREEFSDTQSIERLNLVQLQEIPALDFYTALSSMKDVDVVAHGLVFQSINSRGFTATGNTRFLQIVDGMDNQSPGFGFAMGNFNGITDLDLESVEIRHGPESSKFGTGAFNGVLIMRSKDPFESQGFSLSSKLAANRFNEGWQGYADLQAGMINEHSLRYATSIGSSLAVKVTASLFSATDWIADDLRNIGEGDPNGFQPFSPAYDGVNIYGDESPTLIQTPLSAAVRLSVPFLSMENPSDETAFMVTRTGYRERALVDYGLQNYRISSSLHYKITAKTRAILQWNLGKGSTMYTGDNRVYLGDMTQWQGKVELASENWSIRGYTTQQRINRAYDSRFLALHLNEYARSDREWLDTYGLIYGGWIVPRGLAGLDHAVARSSVDDGVRINPSQEGQARLMPLTDEFNSVRDQLIATQGFENGAGFTDQSKLYHVEGTYGLSDFTPDFQTEVGASFRFYDPESGGIVFGDSSENDITMMEYGLYAESSGQIFNDRTRAIFSARLDKNENFSARLSPRFSVLYDVTKEGKIRGSIQSGFRFPSIKEQFAFQNLGGQTLIGGLDGVLQNLDLFENSFFQQGVIAFNEAVRAENEPAPGQPFYSREQAELRNLGILEESIVQIGGIRPLLPETVRTIELGYRSYFADRKLYLDVNGYLNAFKDFIGVIRVVKPATSPRTDLFIASGQVNRANERDVYFLYTNAKSDIFSQGVSLKADFIYSKVISIGGNATWSNLTQNTENGFIPGFNTPRLKGNVSVRLSDKKRNLLLKGSVRMREAFQWQSNFGDGTVAGYALIDLQLTKKLPEMHTSLKMGISNLANKYYTDVFGGAQIGAVPFLQLVYDPSKPTN